MDHLTSSTDSNKVGFLGVGHAVPSIIRDNSTWPKALLDKLEARRAQTFIDPDESKLARGSAEDKIQLEEMLKWRDVAFFGTHERRVCEPNRLASSLELEACRAALDMAKLPASAIDLILCSSAPADAYMPGNASLLQRELDVGPTMAFTVDAACASVPAMLMVAQSLLESGPARYALVVASVVFSRLVDPYDPQSIIIGDGAGAAVIGPTSTGIGFLGHGQWSLGSCYDAAQCTTRTASPWYAGGEPLQAISNNRTLAHQNLLRVGAQSREYCTQLLERINVSPAKIDHFIGHQGLAWFPETCRRAARLDGAQLHQSYRRFANAGGASTLINLSEAVRSGAIDDGDSVLLLATGMGVTWSSSVLRWGISS